jgi:hypothetical protein
LTSSQSSGEAQYLELAAVACNNHLITGVWHPDNHQEHPSTWNLLLLTATTTIWLYRVRHPHNHQELQSTRRLLLLTTTNIWL